MANTRNRIAGTLALIVNGETHNIAGDWEYNLGAPKRTGVVGPDRVHGYMEEPQVPFIQGKVRDRANLNVLAMLTIDDATVVLPIANGKTVVLRSAWQAGEGTIAANSAEIDTRFEGLSADEV